MTFYITYYDETGLGIGETEIAVEAETKEEAVAYFQKEVQVNYYTVEDAYV
jgi:hypothetical protein